MRYLAAGHNVKLIDESIDKWKDIVYHGGHDYGATDCALCNEYNTDGNDCVGCPIYKQTGKLHCGKAPYIDWCIYLDSEDTGGCRMVYDETSRALANAMLVYLYELRLKYVKWVVRSIELYGSCK